MIPACPSLMCPFNSGIIEGTNSSEMYVYVCMFCFYVCIRIGFVD